MVTRQALHVRAKTRLRRAHHDDWSELLGKGGYTKTEADRELRKMYQAEFYRYMSEELGEPYPRPKGVTTDRPNGRQRIVDGVQEYRCARCRRWATIDAYVKPTPSSKRKGEPVGNGLCKRCLRIIHNARNAANSALRRLHLDEWQELYARELIASQAREDERDPLPPVTP